jgi:hypothetical protein
MNRDALRSLARIVDRMERQASRPRRRFSTAPIVLGLGLVLADALLAKLVPMLWETLLPHGLEQAEALRGWPGLVWRGSVLCQTRQTPVLIGIAAAVVVGLLCGSAGRPLRFLVWVSAAGVIALNAAILIVTMQTSLRATASAAGLDF